MMKKFLIIGNLNAVTYKEVFPLVKENELWLGASGVRDMAFMVPDDYGIRDTRSWRDESGVNWRSLGNACWFTNIESNKCNEPIDLYKKYNEAEYPKYDNYDAIEVSKVSDIPVDYDGVMGVPKTFVGKYCPEQFEIVDVLNDSAIQGKVTYARIAIRKK